MYVRKVYPRAYGAYKYINERTSFCVEVPTTPLPSLVRDNTIHSTNLFNLRIPVTIYLNTNRRYSYKPDVHTRCCCVYTSLKSPTFPTQMSDVAMYGAMRALVIGQQIIIAIKKSSETEKVVTSGDSAMIS